MKSLFLAFTVLCLVFGAQAANYAVLVAGSNYFYNYRHQSDIFHAYQNLIKNGFDKANIITMAYDDIANDPENPFPGQVYNKPSDGPGEDVYAGVVIDYSGEDVTPTNFLNVLSGNSTANKGKKVLHTTSKDNIFIYFSDHGATGLIAFPSEYLYADDLIATLKAMHTGNKYKELVFYLEACESGSMFDQILPNNIKIYTTTAANPDESSWAYYCSPDDTVNGTEIGSCLGDEYSIHFLENWESSKVSSETLLKQFQIVKNQTLESHVQQYGQLSIDKEVIGHFEANGESHEPIVKDPKFYDVSKIRRVNSRDVKLYYLQKKHDKHQNDDTRAALLEELQSIERFDTTFSSISELFKLDTSVPVENIDFACLKERVAMYEGMCGKFSDYGLQYVRYLHFTCTQGVNDFDFESALVSLCF